MGAKKLWLSPFSALSLFEFDTVGSTNTLAKEYAREKKRDAVFTAREQTGGRGRLGRSFSSPSGAGLYMSMLIHPKKSISDTMKLTALAAVAVCRVIERHTELSPKIKWVNDIQLGGKKIAGILAEGEFSAGGALKYAVIGIGLNIERRDFGELSEIAVSLGDFMTNPPSAQLFLREIVREFYRLYRKSELSEELDYYRQHSSVIGKKITVYKKNSEFSAYAEDIDEGFALIIERDGKREILTSAEVSLRTVAAE